MKWVLILNMFFCMYLNCSSQDAGEHWNLDCDTFTYSGYIVTLVHKEPLSSGMATYFAFLPDSIVNSDEKIKSLIVNNNEDFFWYFKKIVRCKYKYLLHKLSLPVIYNNDPIDDLVLKSNCSKEFKYERILRDFYNGDRPNLPSVTMVGLKNSSYGRFYYYNIKKYKFRGLKLTYNTYENYIKEQFTDPLRATPKSHNSMFYDKRNILIKKIHTVRKQTGYKIILPYKLLQ